MAKILFFFTSSYPYGTGETFIENEIEYLSDAFDKVVIISNDYGNKVMRNIPDNCSSEHLPYELSAAQKVSALGSFLFPAVWKELIIILTRYKIGLSKLVLTTVIQSFWKTIVFRKLILQMLSKYSKSEDEIYFYSYWSNDIALAIARLPRVKNEKIRVSRAHGWDVYFEANQSGYLPFRKELIERLDCQHFISQKGYDYYATQFPELTHKLQISRLGVPGRENVRIERDKNKFVIVSCSNVIPLKRVHLVAEALGLIEDYTVEWHHFGDGPLLDKLKDVCSYFLEKKENAKFKLHGRVPNSEYLSFLKTNQVDLFINVSTTEGIPVSIMEAFSFGIPALATKVGGTGEILNQSNGYLIPKECTSTLIAEHIIEFKGLSAEDKLKLSKNAFYTWETLYNAGTNYKSFIATHLLN